MTTVHTNYRSGLVVAFLEQAIKATRAGDVVAAEGWLRGAWREMAAHPTEIETEGTQ